MLFSIAYPEVIYILELNNLIIQLSMIELEDIYKELLSISH